MVERGFTDPRYTADIPSMSRLAESVGVHASTVSGVIYGRRRPSPATVAALVGALGSDVQDWLGVHVELGPYEPPAESALLTASQRDALTALIRSIAVEQREAGGPDGDPTLDSRAPVSGADETGGRGDEPRRGDMGLAADDIRTPDGLTEYQRRTGGQDAASEAPDPPGPEEGA